MADDEVLKLAVLEAMLELKYLRKKYAGADNMFLRDWGRANVAYCGILVLGTWAGRDGEWVRMLASYVREHLKKRQELSCMSQP